MKLCIFLLWLLSSFPVTCWTGIKTTVWLSNCLLLYLALSPWFQCLKHWGFRRCEDICWIKTNKNNPKKTKALDPKAVLQRTKVQCTHVNTNFLYWRCKPMYRLLKGRSHSRGSSFLFLCIFFKIQYSNYILAGDVPAHSHHVKRAGRKTKRQVCRHF